MTNVLVVGSVNMDLVMKAPRLPAPGETLVGGQFTVVPGGKGANQAASAARLGCSVRLIAAVGEDDFGRAALANLETQGVDSRLVSRLTGTATGVAMIVVDAAGENTIIVASGANAALTPEAVTTNAEAFAWADSVVLQCEIPLATVLAAIAAAKAAGTLVILNAAPAVASLPDQAFQVDYLVVNEQEAAALTGVEPRSPAMALEAARQLNARGAKHAVITLGALGCVYSDGSISEHIPAPQVEAVDTTAAGDAFIGALATALGESRPSRQALCYANCAGALAVTKLGAQSSLPDAQSVAGLYRQHCRS
ncbi:MAG: ribokinase [Anaerolineae bacterium]